MRCVYSWAIHTHTDRNQQQNKAIFGRNYCFWPFTVSAFPPLGQEWWWECPNTAPSSHLLRALTHTLGEVTGRGALETSLQAGSGCDSPEEFPKFPGPSWEWTDLGWPEGAAGAWSNLTNQQPASDSCPPEMEKLFTLGSAQPPCVWPCLGATWASLPCHQQLRASWWAHSDTQVQTHINIDLWLHSGQQAGTLPASKWISNEK